MKRRLILLLLVSLALAAAGGWYVYRTMSAMPAPAAGGQPQPEQTVRTVNGETVVTVGAEAQRASGIRTVPISASTVRAQQSAYATVIDLQPLFDLRQRAAAARAERAVAQVQAELSRAQYQRSRRLFDDDRNVSQKALQNARAAMQTDQARLQAATVAGNAVDVQARQQFGDMLARAAAALRSPPSSLMQRLQQGRASVVLVTLVETQAAPAHVTVDGADGEAIPAQRLSAAPQADPAVQGKPYLYATERAMPAGIRTRARWPAAGKHSAGLLIPEDAVVWYGGQAWAYVRSAPEQFARRILSSPSAVDRGYLVHSGFHRGDQVVIRGAQLLLSEELRPQGISTQCKDPPECDD